MHNIPTENSILKFSLRYFTADYSDKALVLSRCPLTKPSDWLLTPVFCDEAGNAAVSHKEQVHSMVDHML